MLPAQVSYWTLEEGKTHNRNVEQESYRHNIAMEQYNRDELARKREEMEANIRLKEREIEEQHRANVARERYNAQMAQNSFMSIAETQRHNIAYEQEVARHNVATIYETNRHNTAQEQIQQQNVDLGFVNAGISSRNVDVQKQRVTNEYKLGQERNTQGWLSTTGNLLKTATDFVRFAVLKN